MARRILLIDDDELLRTAIGDLLESNGYIVASAGAGDAGLAMFRAARPDLVITDLTMPEPNGLDTSGTLSKEAAAAADHRDFRRRRTARFLSICARRNPRADAYSGKNRSGPMRAGIGR